MGVGVLLMRSGALALGSALVLAACSTSSSAPVEITVDPPPPTASSTSTASPKPTNVPSSSPLPIATVKSGPSAEPVETSAPNTAQWACTKVADCTQTCALGAVSFKWLQAHRDADTCDDGCGWKGTEIGCVDGSCVTLMPNGGIDKSCSFKPYPPPPR